MSCCCPSETVEYTLFTDEPIIIGDVVSAAVNSAGFRSMDVLIEFTAQVTMTQIRFLTQQSWDGGATFPYITTGQQTGTDQLMLFVNLFRSNLAPLTANRIIHTAVPIEGEQLRMIVTGFGAVLPGDVFSLSIRLHSHMPVVTNYSP